ncbi:ATP-dependent DNA helicase srs2 [Rhodotorula kratochvilovae]
MEPPDDLSDSEYLPEPSTSNEPPENAPTKPEAGPAALKQSTLTFNQLSPEDYLPRLNPAQRDAVTASSVGGLAVHAGPGSGKTAVLTTRVAHLIQVGRIAPEELVVVTFTNKAANEMKVRLSKIVGAQTVDKIVMGTFHSVCVRYLRKYAKLLNLAPNFLITDRDDCLAIIKRLLASLTALPDNLRREMKPQSWLEVISKCKSRKMGPEEYRAESASAVGGDPEKVEWVARVYEAYVSELAASNALDFDDLLLRGYQLFRNFPRVVAKIKSVLIDEFQDTNNVQYELVKLIAAPSGSLTIVGDPDQSIYGWRNAEIENLEKMLKDFHPVRQIFLEENYRSTGAILGAALAVVQQDTARIPKSLRTSHPAGSSVVLHPAPSAPDEAAFIASTIKHLVAHLGGLVGYNDFAVLLRYGALSRNIEVALQKAGVPSRMVGGHKFFERAEVKDLLSYLQLISNPSYTPALLRVLNTPRRGLGDKTQREIAAVGVAKRIGAFEVCRRIANGQGLVKVTDTQRKGVKALVQLVRDAREKADEGADVASLIDLICERVYYKQHLERTQGPDAAERWENIEELKAYAATVAEENPTTADLFTAADPEEGESQFEEVDIPAAATTGAFAGGAKDEGGDSDDDVIVVEPEVEDEKEEIKVPLSSQAAEEGATTPLEIFLATSMLATDTETQGAKSDANAEKVTISTCHAAKGLEWPVVFVPACEDGTYPFFRASEASEVDEERRLLYVAITRAQSFCFLSYAAARMAGSEMKQKKLSPFLQTASTSYPSLFVKKLQKVTKKTREETAKVLGRQAPSEEQAKRMIDDTATMPVEPLMYDASQATSATSRNYSTFGSSSGRYGGFGGFNSASQGRYAGSGTSSGGGFSQGRYSNAALAQAKSQPVPAGQGGFRSALSTLKAAPSVSAGVKPLAGGFASASAATVPSASAPAAGHPRAFKLPAMMNPSVPSRGSAPPRATPASLASLSASSVAPFSAASARLTATHGPPGVTETRASLISDAVLVNPTLEAPKQVPTAQRDLLASFQRGAGDELDVLKRLAAPVEGGDAVSSTTAPGGGAPLSPKKAGGKRASAGSAAACGKKARK